MHSHIFNFIKLNTCVAKMLMSIKLIQSITLKFLILYAHGQNSNSTEFTIMPTPLLHKQDIYTLMNNKEVGDGETLLINGMWVCNFNHQNFYLACVWRESRG